VTHPAYVPRRSDEWIFDPEAAYEMCGEVANVTFRLERSSRLIGSGELDEAEVFRIAAASR
jgi:hypothetical protein